MKLSDITRGVIASPVRIVLYGTDGVGKTTFAAAAPKPIFLPVEEGTNQMDVARLPQPKTWEDALEAVSLLTNEKHDYRTFVVDTIDWLERLCWDHVCRVAKKADIEDFGYGKGYVAAFAAWCLYLDALDALSRRGMNIILLSHAAIRPFQNPTGDNYDKWNLAMHATSAGKIRGWADNVLFARYQVFTTKESAKAKAKAVGDGARALACTEKPGWFAKNRYSLPDELPLDWEAFDAACKAHTPASAAELLDQIAELSSLLPPDNAALALAAVKLAQKNPAKLAQILSKMKSQAAINEGART